ncbi:MAG: FecR domain-containing protein, partial [Planctomycetales bacterium]|nr:FecR domain-containing protein [Planctomycetales bacterium]
DLYWEIIGVHSQLEWELSDRAGDGATFAHQLAASDVASLRGPTKSRLFRMGPLLLALAATLLIAVVGRDWGRRGVEGDAPRGSDGELATVVGNVRALSVESRWSFGRPGVWNLNRVRQGDTISLDEGEIELQFPNDTVARLKAPSVMQVVAIDRVRVLRGGVKVDVANGAEGFAVETASAEIVDLGTVFSVSVEKSGTNVVVFDGQVDLKVAGSNEQEGKPAAAAAKRFQAGEAVHVDVDGTLSRIVNVNGEDFASSGLAASRGPLIRELRDNIVRDDMWSFYEIVPSGLAEDAKAFVDRPHEWNGEKSTGMPAYLAGADYVKTFNDDKLAHDLRIELELQRAADVYIFMDNRLSPPSWLVEQFVATGDVIGIDEAPYRADSPSHLEPGRLQKGAGRSVDRTFSIWRRTAVRGEIVVLGSNGVPVPEEEALGIDAKSNMYGIAATPRSP